MTMQTLFGEEQERFRKEGVPWQPVLWSDFHLTLDLLEKVREIHEQFIRAG